MPSPPRVLFVSKPIVPPWHDGSKNLVRDVAAHLSRARPTVLTTAGATSIGARVNAEPIYRSAGRFAPGIAANARVLARLLTGDAHDVWHFVSAPNPAASSAARLARVARRMLGWKGRIVQTVASAPREFDGVASLLFGDVVVTLSEWTRARLIGEGVDASALRVIFPCAAAPPRPTDDAVHRARARYGLGSAKVVLYPGDYEISTGARTFADAIKVLAPDAPDVVFVYACREKTPRAGDAREKLKAELAAVGLTSRVRHVGEIDDLPALTVASSVVAFPVDDLYGKVDLPLVLLEALALGVPLVLARGGPLETLGAASFVDPGDGVALAAEIAALLVNDDRAREHAVRGKDLYSRSFTPQVVADQYDDLYEEIFTENR